MDRKNFLRKVAAGAAAAMTGISAVKATGSTYDKLMKQVGFNHLPNNEITNMKTVLHKASTRGHANHGWLNSHHSFSFANYYHPERMHFGVLRVLNDDVVASGRGFGTHPHDNMEIISIPLEGDLQHKDNMGNVTTIREGDVQVMSAGTGILHSEYNHNPNKPVKFLQIWLFPNQKNVSPRYDQITLESQHTSNTLYQILSPNPDDEGVWIHQNAWFHMGNLDAGVETSYELKDKSNGVYVFVLEGDVTIENQALSKRDGYGLWDIEGFSIKSSTDSKLLLMEVPMQLA